MKKLLHYGGNIAEAIIALFLYGVLQIFYFTPKLAHQKFHLIWNVQIWLTAILTVVIMWFVFWMYKKQLKEVNYWDFNEEPHWSAKRVGIAILGFIVIVAIQIILFNFFGHALPNNQKELNLFQRQNMILFRIMVVFIAPFCEEVIFRGMFFNTFFTKATTLNKWLGIIVSGFAFAYLHDPAMTKFIFIYWGMGCVLGWVYMTTKDLRYSMLAHMLNNAMSVL